MRSSPRLVLALACALAAAGLPAQVATNPKRVLFIGNSLTAGNDVPALVQAMAQLQGVRLEYDALAPGGYAIEDHWADGNHLLLESGNYDVVILQQGPSTLTDSQVNLREWTMTWAAAARQNGTLPALYMIWPVRTQSNGFLLVSQSYRNAAQAADAAVFPAGEVWQQVMSAHPTIPLYSGDNLHALPAGSFLAAMVIARGLVALDPARVPATVKGITVPAATLDAFRAAVATLPATSLPASPATAPPPDATNPAPVTPAPAVSPSPATPAVPGGGGGGGGGAPSSWFLLALLTMGATRSFRYLATRAAVR